MPVHGIKGPDHPAWFTLFRRLTEVEIHHVDLNAGYGPPDWPEPFVADELERVTSDWSVRDDVAPFVIEVGGTGHRYPVGPATGDAVTVTAPGCWLLAWLTGRDAGTGLSVRSGPGADDGGVPPQLPTWG